MATPEEVARIVAAIDERYRAMVLLAAYRSLRHGELAGLRRGRVDLLHRVITVEEQGVELAGGRVVTCHPKSAAGVRRVAIPPELVPLLEDHLTHFVASEPEALAFTSPEGHPLRRTKFRRRWVAACDSAGLTALHFHDLRGSGATWAAHAGATLREVMERLGHSTPAVALRYQHATAQRDQAIAERLGTLMRAAAEPPEPVADIVSIKP